MVSDRFICFWSDLLHLDETKWCFISRRHINRNSKAALLVDQCLSACSRRDRNVNPAKFLAYVAQLTIGWNWRSRYSSIHLCIFILPRLQSSITPLAGTDWYTFSSALVSAFIVLKFIHLRADLNTEISRRNFWLWKAIKSAWVGLKHIHWLGFHGSNSRMVSTDWSTMGTLARSSWRRQLWRLHHSPINLGNGNNANWLYRLKSLDYLYRSLNPGNHNFI